MRTREKAGFIGAGVAYFVGPVVTRLFDGPQSPLLRDHVVYGLAVFGYGLIGAGLATWAAHRNGNADPGGTFIAAAAFAVVMGVMVAL